MYNFNLIATNRPFYITCILKKILWVVLEFLSANCQNITTPSNAKRASVDGQVDRILCGYSNSKRFLISIRIKEERMMNRIFKTFLKLLWCLTLRPMENGMKNEWMEMEWTKCTSIGNINNTIKKFFENLFSKDEIGY